MIDNVARRSWTGLIALVSLMSADVALADSAVPPSSATTVRNGSIAFAITSLRWATYLKPDGQVECPAGVNDGPREQFAVLFPANGQERALADTQLKREVQNWFPTTAPDYFKFREPAGTQALGINLDDRVDPDDFTSPEGEKGVDNQLYRALGCINSYRDANGTNDSLNSAEILTDSYNRLLIEINGVTSLENSPNVEVMVYRGLDPLRTDAGGNRVLPGQTQRVDVRWGAKFIQRLQGKIENGVLITEPHDFTFPWSVFSLPADEYLRDARLRLKLTDTTAEGLIGGYTDIETWYLQLMKSQSTHCQSYGQLASMSLYKAMRRLADAYPDPKTGANTAISSALRASFTQVYILPESKVGVKVATAAQMAPYAGPPYPRSPADDEHFLPVSPALSKAN